MGLPVVSPVLSLTAAPNAMRRGLLIALLAANVSFMLARGPASEEACIADWSVAAPIVEKEGLVTIERLGPLVRSRLGAAIVKATLCYQEGEYVFQLVVRSPEGPLRRVTLNARMPFAP